MEKKEDKAIKNKNGVTNHNGVSDLLYKQIEARACIYQENITSIDLSSKNIKALDDNMQLPVNLLQLNLSHNKLVEVPAIVLNLDNLKVLNISNNCILYFDDIPNFCHTLEQIDISNNHLERPPYWIWKERPEKLRKVMLSNNINITRSLSNGYSEELLECTTLVTDIDLHNCSLQKHADFLITFPKAKYLCLGADEYKVVANSFTEIPCNGLDKCCDLERLNLCNTQIYTINPSIEMYKYLVEINLAQNNLNDIPNEFCNLQNLEICFLSYNKLLYLPEEMCKMRKLVRLYLNGNELCMLPDKLCELCNLKTLDLYDNNLNDTPNNYGNLEELDLAQNYFNEPDNSTYLEMKEKIRLAHDSRSNGRKNIIDKFDYDDDHSSCASEDDDELYEMFFNGKQSGDPPISNPEPSSSPEDWDSDDYWVPFYQQHVLPTKPKWVHFIKQKLSEGNFCPIDAHPVSITERVSYEELCNPQQHHESDGQYDDYSSDNT